MEPVEHVLMGACLARAGLNRKAAYATLGMAVAAEFPDIDTLWSIDGPVAAFQHHRGWTHTFLGLPFEATFLLVAVWLLHRWRVGRRATTKPPVRWGVLWGCILLALASHLFLDWTNNYGLRPFFPFDPHWYAGSFVFIFEPVMFGLLVIGLVMPSLFGLINAEVGDGRVRFRGRGWAIFALLGVSAMWGWRFVEHGKAVAMAAGADLTQIGTPAKIPPRVLKVSASPYPIDLFHWHTVVDTPGFYRMGTVDTRTQTLAPSLPRDTVFKSAPTLATLRAKRSWLGEAYLDWSQFPVVQQTSVDPNPDGPVTVEFRDLRFAYDTQLLKLGGRAPLSGTVSLDRDHRVVGMEMDGRVQH